MTAYSPGKDWLASWLQQKVSSLTLGFSVTVHPTVCRATNSAHHITLWDLGTGTQHCHADASADYRAVITAHWIQLSTSGTYKVVAVTPCHSPWVCDSSPTGYKRFLKGFVTNSNTIRVKLYKKATINPVKSIRPFFLTILSNVSISNQS